MNLLKWLKAKRNLAREIAPQLTTWQRDALLRPGPVPGGHPYGTYALMESDSMVQTALTIKKLGVLAAPWTVRPADPSSEAARRAAFVEESFERMEGSPLSIMGGALDSFGKGWSVQEAVYRLDGRQWWLQAVRPKDPEFFGQQIDAFGRMTGLRLEVPGEPPIDLPIEKFIVHQNRPLYGGPRGRSDLDAAYRHWAAKDRLLTSWSTHLARFASPTMLASFAVGASAADREALVTALGSVGGTSAIAYPNDFVVDKVSSEAEASKGFMEAVEFHNREIARAILGQTLTTDEGRRVGSLALGKIHLQVLMLQLEALRRELADLVMTEQVIRPLVELNFGPGHTPRFEFAPVPLGAFTGAVL